VNRGAAKVEGLEFQANWRLAKNTSLLVNHSYIHIRETQDGLKRDYVTSAPRNTFSALLTHRFNRQWDASYAYYQTSQNDLLGDGEEVDLIRKSDLRLARKFESGRWNGEVTMIIENLFNDHYEEFAQYNTFNRRGRINVRLDF
jgi:iron complex outermembrane receptor protein